MIFKKTLVNFAMIQTVLLATSISVGSQVSFISNSAPETILLVWITGFIASFAPSLLISFLFAAVSR